MIINQVIKKIALPLAVSLSLSTNVFAATNEQLQNQVNQLNTKVRQLENQINYLMDRLEKYNQYQSSIDNLRNQIEVNNHKIQTTDEKITQTNKIYDQKLSDVQKDLSAQIKKVEVQKLRDPQDVVFENAYNLMLKRQYKSALKGFSDYVNSYYNGRHYSESLYYMGVLYLTDGKISSAKSKFKRIVDRYPKSVKYPDSLVQLGAIYRVEGNTKLAKSYFNKVIKNYPNSKAANLAKTELKKIKS
ncbi:tol-pal system protein YbgF [Thiotrichales bacterium 19X7-9]|nr:tol-pal system protein YbgF [Thiotrichales bacterium 19X7-9]MCF6774969.1 tol-pal system protein YbgF [Thiotrichales bacterium 19X7-9]